MLSNYLKLQKLSNKLYFTPEDLAYILDIQISSTKVLCSRYVKNKLFIRLKRNFYTFSEAWDDNTQENFFEIANIFQVPSYISLTTALVFYEVTTQVQNKYFESVCVKRTVSFNKNGVTFNFYKLKKNLYFDFIKNDKFFIATKEKAFIDAVYLYSFGKYKLDFNAIDFNKLDNNKLRNLINFYPDKTKDIIKKLCKI
ncbi:hypothetical protein HZA55_02495 [Candidatus Poribacteria bacterium]|nr:hypothetical protein [Candidatus Poribacteria bacterium]